MAWWSKCISCNELQLRDGAIQKLRTSRGLTRAVHKEALELIVNLQAKLQKLDKKAYEFQVLRDELHAKDVKIEKLERDIKGWERDCEIYLEKLVKLEKEEQGRVNN